MEGKKERQREREELGKGEGEGVALSLGRGWVQMGLVLGMGRETSEVLVLSERGKRVK
jgi:hypothetical protein